VCMCVFAELGYASNLWYSESRQATSASVGLKDLCPSLR
jgi:hypothetical protein